MAKYSTPGSYTSTPQQAGGFSFQQAENPNLADIANELAERNRLKRLEMQILYLLRNQEDEVNKERLVRLLAEVHEDKA